MGHADLVHQRAAHPDLARHRASHAGVASLPGYQRAAIVGLGVGHLAFNAAGAQPVGETTDACCVEAVGEAAKTSAKVLPKTGDAPKTGNANCCC